MASFATSLSGLNASSVALSVISNNLANINTIGFKTNQANFQDLFYQQIGNSGNQRGRVSSPGEFALAKNFDVAARNPPQRHRARRPARVDSKQQRKCGGRTHLRPRPCRLPADSLAACGRSRTPLGRAARKLSRRFIHLADP